MKIYFFSTFFLIIMIVSCNLEYYEHPFKDRKEIEIVCDYPYDGDPSGLIITEVTHDWIEVFNNRNVETEPLCLGRYQLRASRNFQVEDRYYNIPNYPIEPQTYVVIRFLGDYYNSSSNVIIVNGPGLVLENNRYVGFYELTHTNSDNDPKTIDYMGFCNDEGNLAVSPVSGVFTDCVNYAQGNYLSFSRSLDLVDTDSADDWSSVSTPTFGGGNDVVNDTDNDNDGIPDANEMEGTTYAGMPLHDWGARPNQRDIFIYISYMEGSDIKRGLVPPKESLSKIKEVFSTNGFTVHFDVGDLYSPDVGNDNYNMSGNSHEVMYSEYTTMSDMESFYEESLDTISAIYYKNQYMPINRFGIFHHALFANRFSDRGIPEDDTLGIAELQGNDIIIFLGGFIGEENYNEQKVINLSASILFHELGHNLGLQHGGFEFNNHKPNYFSSMNYGYAFAGVPTLNNTNSNNFYNRYLIFFQDIEESYPLENYIDSENFIINYSYGTLPDINENELLEQNPLGNGLGDIDWNMDGVIDETNYAFDVNPIDETTNRILKDYNEWENIVLPFDYENSFGYHDLKIPLSPVISSRFKHLSREENLNTIQCDFHGFHFQ